MASLAASAPRVVVRRAAARNRLLLAHTRRGFAGSSAARPQQLTAKDAADHLMASYGGKTTSRRQLIDPNQLQKLALTLGRPHLPGTGGGGGDIDVSDVAPPAGTPVPPAYHLVYFTPGGLESELGIDGTDTSFNAAAPFTRRMWAGGVMKWPPGGGEHPGIRVGDVVEERTSLLSAVPKKSRSAGEMVLVEVAKELWTPRGLAAVDQRSWVFRPQLNPDAEVTPPPLPPTSDLRGLSVTRDDDVHATRHLSWSPVGLFRFSALTFNGHKIHYSQEWARSVEGHAGLVVHGPLNLICLLDYWRDVHGGGGDRPATPRQVTYRAVSPIYAGEAYQVVTGEVRPARADGGDGLRAWDIIVEKGGTTCMKAEVLAS